MCGTGGTTRVRYLTTRVRHLTSTGMESPKRGSEVQQGRPTMGQVCLGWNLEVVWNGWGDKGEVLDDEDGALDVHGHRGGSGYNGRSIQVCLHWKPCGTMKSNVLVT